MKYLLWAVVVYVAWRWYAASKQSASKQAAARSASSAESVGPGADGAAEAMVQCAECGIHLPYSEAVFGADAITFCSEAHRAAHRR